MKKLKRERNNDFVKDLQMDFCASDYDMMMIFGTSAREQAQYLNDNPHLKGIVEPIEGFITKSIQKP